MIEAQILWKMNISRKRSRKRLFEDDDVLNNMNKNKNKNNVSYITEDLIVEILLRLPPLSVLRFQRVCKQWYSLISNPDFLRTHSSPSSPFQLHNNSTTPHHDHQHFLVFTKSRVEYVPLTQFEKDRKLPPPSSSLIKRLHLYLPPGGYKFIDYCNGLFLFEPLRTRFDNMAVSYYIYNPINKHYFKLPDIMSSIPKVEKKYDLFYSLQTNLVFEPSLSLSYKVVRLLKSSPIHWMNWHIYSSETGSWRLLSTTFPPRKHTSIRLGFGSVLLNGVLYWLYSFTRGDVSVYFDVDKECVWFLPLPPKPEHSFRECLYMGKCGGRLRLIETFLDVVGNKLIGTPNNLPCSFDIMETEPQQQQDGVHCTWNVKYRVNIGSVSDLLSKNHAAVVHCYKTKNRRENEEQQEVLLLRLNDRSIVSINLTSKKFIKEIVYPENTQVCDFKDTFAYTPILYPLS